MSDRYLSLWNEAVKHADYAEQQSKPGRFGVVERVNPLDDTSPVVREYTNGGRGYEAEGTAIIKVNGNSGFGRWLKRNGDRITYTRTDWYGGTSKVVSPYVRTGGYYGGVTFGAPPRGYERSITWAAAFVGYLDEHEPKAKATYYSFID